MAGCAKALAESAKKHFFKDHLTHCLAVRLPLITEVSRPWHQEGIYRRGMSRQTIGALGQSIEARLPDGVRIKDGLSP